MNLTDNALITLRERYLLKDNNGNVIETPDELVDRVAMFIGDTDEYKEKYRRIISELDFLPNSPTIFSAGRKNPLLAACFVIEVDDSMDGIFDAVKHGALITQRCGGLC